MDIQESPEDIEILSKPRLIPVIYQNAKDVGEIVKAVFADKMGDDNNSGRGGGGGGGGGGQPSPQDFIAALRGGAGGRGGRGDTATSEPSKIVVSVDERSNSLVVIATPQDFEDVRELVEELDQRGISAGESVEVVALPGNMNAEAMREAIEAVLGKQVKTTTNSGSNNTASQTPGGGGGGDGGTPSAAEIQSRIDAFRARFGGGGAPGSSGPFGGGGPGGGFGGGRGGPVGGGGGFGGGGGGPGGGGQGGGGRGGPGGGR